MLISCRFSIVGLHLLLLTHIAHSFVLLTANVDDVKKIARKFVSESLAEKIADFIARATDTMSQKKDISEENEKNAHVQESSQVSAENGMFKIERPGGESQVAEEKSKEEIVLGKVTVKVPKTTAAEKKKHRFDEPDTTRKPKREPKPLHGRSRYIVESDNKASPATEKAPSKLSEEGNYNKMKESIQQLEENLFNTPDGKSKNKKQKRRIKGKAFKLLSGSASVENDPVKDGISGNKVTKDDEILFNVRANDEKVLTSPNEEATTGMEQHDSENEKQNEKAATDVTQYETKEDKSTEIEANNEPLHKKRTDEFDNYENKIIQKTHKTAKSGSRSFMGERDVKEVNWWEKQLPASDEEINSKGKSWF